MRPVPAPGLSYRLGRGTVALRPDGSIEAVRPVPRSSSYLVVGGRVRARVGGVEVPWSGPTVAADVDEVEFGFTAARGLGLVVRHSFTADWVVRVAFVSHTLDPLSLVAELAWEPAPECPAWALAAGATGGYVVPAPDGHGPLLGGQLVLGACDAVSEHAIGLGEIELGPLERRVVQWRWGWYANPRAFVRNRFAHVPRDLVLAENESARILADDDAAVVAPGVDTVRRGPHLELSVTGRHRVSVEIRSHRGVTAYEMEWVERLDDGLAEVGDRLLEGPRSRAGVVLLADVDAALVVQYLLVHGRLGNPDQADDALGLFVARAAGSEAVDGRGVSLLCGEFERTGDPDLLEDATASLVTLDRPVPGLGLAAAQVCVARLTQGQSLDPVLTHLERVAEATAEADLDDLATSLELRLTTAPRGDGGDPDRRRTVEVGVRRIGAALGAGLPGRPVRPLPVDRQAYLAVVLGLLPEALGARARPDWGVRPHEVARAASAQVLARLAGQAPRAAHSWLIMGARLA
ncbi:MAG TPA: hypothetical protein VE476_15130 [Propionibacteriaceae bacterium]|nr:hypothetical protein [Propionibacteriaceae bacterium]